MPEARQTENGDNGHDEPGKAFRDAMSQMGEFKAYASQYLAARADELRLTIRGAVVWAALWTIAALAGAALIITAVVLVAQGLAMAMASALNGRVWAGNLIVGFLLLLLAGIALRLAASRFVRELHAETMARYERRLEHQRAKYGHDAHERSGEHPGSAKNPDNTDGV